MTHRMVFALLCCFMFIRASTAQSLPVVNGSADVLPKPVYSKEFKNLCASGKVSIKVTISPNGLVENASPVSGDPVLYDSAVSAAKRARFRLISDLPRIRRTGLLIYNFPAERRWIEAGVINKKSINIPRPELSAIEHLSSSAVVVEVRIIVDILSGEVKFARAISGDTVYHSICEKSALKAKFAGAMIDGQPVDVKATLVYKFNPDGTIEF